MIEDVRLDRVRLAAEGALQARARRRHRVRHHPRAHRGWRQRRLRRSDDPDWLHQRDDRRRRGGARRPWRHKLVGCSREAAQAPPRRDLADAPFTLTAFVTAIEMAECHPLLTHRRRQGVPLLAGINAINSAGIEREIEAAVANRLRHAQDQGRVRPRCRSRSASPSSSAATLAAPNSASTPTRATVPPTACALPPALSPDSIELLEQPCARRPTGTRPPPSRKVSTVPLMLDESIYDLEDIKRAAALGARFVKLKLMKMVSLTALAEGLDADPRSRHGAGPRQRGRQRPRLLDGGVRRAPPHRPTPAR